MTQLYSEGLRKRLLILFLQEPCENMSPNVIRRIVSAVVFFRISFLKLSNICVPSLAGCVYWLYCGIGRKNTFRIRVQCNKRFCLGKQCWQTYSSLRDQFSAWYWASFLATVAHGIFCLTILCLLRIVQKEGSYWFNSVQRHLRRDGIWTIMK